MTRLLGLLVGAAVVVGCGSGAFSTRGEGGGSGGDASDSERSDARERGAVVLNQATLSGAPIDADRAWTRGDEAFREGDYAEAQEQFGLVYLADPTYRAGQGRSALQETCSALHNDCFLVMGRLDLLRLEYAGALGDRTQWVAQQETDYRSILDCWDQAIMGNHDVAYYAGHSVTNAPLPMFAQSARACVDRVSVLQSQRAAIDQQREAAVTWDTAYADYREAWAELEPAVTEMDWDAIVDAYPGYKLAEEVVVEIIDRGTLVGDPERGIQVVEASEWLATVRDWEETYGDEYEAMRDAIRALDDDAEYNRVLLEYEEVRQRIPPLEQEIATLEVAREATSGSDRHSVERRIESKEAEIRDLRRELRRIMARVNRMRDDQGLPDRDAPYGLE